MGRPRLHDGNTEQTLLRAAESLLGSEGLEALSVRRLAEAAAVSPRAIYSLFGSMEGLIRALYRQAFIALAADLDALPTLANPAADLVEAGALGFRGWALAHPDLFRMVFESRAPATPSPAEDGRAAAEAFARLLARVRRCAEAGLIPAPEVPSAALAFHALCEGLASLELRGRFQLSAGGDPATAWRGALGALVAGYRPTASGPRPTGPLPHL